MTRQTTDFLIIGSGIAGLFYALRIAKAQPDAIIRIVTKKQDSDTSTNRAQGGIAAVLAGSDSFESHILDTIEAGGGLSQPDVVQQVVKAGPRVISDLLELGVEFTRHDGLFDLGREGGHSANRVVHAQDLTGREIERALLGACRKAPGIEILQHHMAVDLAVDHTHHRCAGAWILNEETEQLELHQSVVTLLATGGLGQIYYHTSNPRIATGDGIAIACRAGVPIGNLEFIQFHPTTLYSPGRWPFLISEAVRGEGGRLRSVGGEYFMQDAHPLGDLAPRDVVARAIDKELKRSGEEYVLLDVSHLDSQFLRKRFPNIHRQCLRYGFDITERSIPVVPAAHYACGGVVADISGETELPGLYAAGEVAMTGMHGANRLASNSLLEAVVMAEFSADRSVAYFTKQRSQPLDFDSTPPARDPGEEHEKILVAHYRRDLQRTMSDFVGIVRVEEQMRLALGKVRRIRFSVDEFFDHLPLTYKLAELRNMTLVAEYVILSALYRQESRGLHYVEDNPEPSEAFLHDTIIRDDRIDGEKE